MARIPQVVFWVHEFSRNRRPVISNRRLSPEALSPCAEFSSHRHTTPEATKDTAMGNRKMERKIPSPLMGRSRSQAHRKPTTRVPARKVTVNRMRLMKEWRKSGLPNRAVKLLSPTTVVPLRPETWPAVCMSSRDVLMLIPIIP